MLKTRLGPLATALVTALSVVGSAAFAQEPSAKQDLSGYMCKDIMRTSGDDREVALALLHGYRLGKMGTTQFDTQILAQATDDFIEYCLDHPNEKALAVFEKLPK